MSCAALLGIVLMNIGFTGLPFAASADPNPWGGACLLITARRGTEARGQILNTEQQEWDKAYNSDIWALMLIGMALFKLGVLEG